MDEYRKTATIRAVQWFKPGDHYAVGTSRHGIAYIKTLEGMMFVNPGDWIATGINGEHWPIKSDVFSKTYERI